VAVKIARMASLTSEGVGGDSGNQPAEWLARQRRRCHEQDAGDTGFCC
jgi:hypothetical protein